MGIRHLQEKGPRIIRACHVINMLDRLMRNLFIIINLNRAMTHTSYAHRTGIVRVTLPLMLPIWDPRKISGIKVGCQTFFKPVKLIWPNKMHLTRKGGLIPACTQIMGIGWDFRGKFSRIVIGTNR